jgi:hypothetical protein
LLEILLIKSAPWKLHKNELHTWIAKLIKKIAPLNPDVKVKQQNVVLEAKQGTQLSPMQFFAKYLERLASQKKKEAMVTLLPFLRMYLLDHLLVFKKEQPFSSDPPPAEWLQLNQVLIAICR